MGTVFEFLALSTCYVLVAARFPAHGTLHDDGIYLQLGTALSAGCYDLSQLPGAPVCHRNPPVFPALLAIPRWFGADPERMPAVFCIPGAMLTALGALLWARLIARSLGDFAGRAIATVFASAPATILFTTTTMSEPIAFAALPALLQLLDDHPGPRRLLLAGSVAAAAALSRPILGAALVGAFVSVFRRGGPRAAALFSLPAVVGAALWGSFLPNGRDAVPPLLDFYVSYDGVLTFAPFETVPEFLLDFGHGTIGSNLSALWLPEVARELGDTGTRLLDVVAATAGLAMLGACAFGPGLPTAASRTVLGFGLAPCLFATVSTWRFVLPFFPLIASGALGLVRSPSRRRRALLVALAATAVAGLPATVLQLQPNPDREARLWAISLPMTELEAQARWVREHTPPDAVLVTDYDPWFHRVTGRRAVMFEAPLTKGERRRGAWTEIADARYAALLRDYRALGVTHVLTNSFLDPTAALLVERLLDERKARIVHQSANPAFTILEFRAR